MNGKKRDPNKVLRGIKHGRSGYNRGCNCLICVTDATRYSEYYKQCRSGVVKGGTSFEAWKIEMGYLAPDPDESPDLESDNVVRLHAVSNPDDVDEMTPVREAAKRRSTRQPGGTTAEPKEMEAAVIEECAGLSMAAERPAMVMAARNMARILDNPKQAALHATANRQMTSILNDLRGNSKRKTKGRLAAVKKMTPGASAIGE